MSALVKVDKRFIDFTVFLRQRNLMARNVIGHLKMATRAFELLEMVGDGFGGHEFVSEQRTQ